MSFPRPSGLRAIDLGAVVDLLGDTARLVGDPEAAAAARDVAVSGVSLSTDAVRPGDLWAALRGANAHGGRYAEQAIAAGAAAILTDEEGAALLSDAVRTVPVLVCPDPRSRLGAISALVYDTGVPGVTLIGVTGTNGKTTTSYLLESALRALGHVTGMIGTIETRIGPERITSVRTTPETTDLHALLAVMRERDVEDCVMEVSSHALTLHRVDAVRYDVAIFTNLSQDHLDFHPTMEDYFAAKARLFTPEHSQRGIVCVDDEWGQRLAATAAVPVMTLASSEDIRADWHLLGDPSTQDFELRPSSPEVRITIPALHLRSALPGDFNRVNTALAALALITLGESPTAAAGAILTPPVVPGRMEVVEQAPDSPIRGVVDFAHTPDAVGAALAALRPQTAGALVAVIGAGGSRDPGKRPGMGRAAAAAADVVVITDDNPRDEDPAAIREAVAAGAADGRATVTVVPGRAEAIRHAVELARVAGSGSMVAVLGKGHEQGQEIAGEVRPFDDRVTLAAALADADRRGAGDR